MTDSHGSLFVHHPRVSFDLLSSKILSGEVRFGKIESDKPEYYSKRLASGNFYLPFLAEAAYVKAEEKAKTDTTGNLQPVVTIDTLDLSQAVIHFTDLSTRGPFSTTISSLDLMLENARLSSDRTAAYQISLKPMPARWQAFRGQPP